MITRAQQDAQLLDMFVYAGTAYRHRPGPPIDEDAWLHEGIIATTTGDVYDARNCRVYHPEESR